VDAADLIAVDIFLRRRRPREDLPKVRDYESAFAGVPPRTVWQSVREDGDGPPLEDNEVREVVRAALEDTIVMPLVMLREVAGIIEDLGGPSPETRSFAEVVPCLQTEEDVQARDWCDPAAFDHAEELRQLLPQIMEWLSGPTPTDGAR
jgi:hypothetical protein